MLSEIERMKLELVTMEELSKAIKQFTAATLSSRKTMQGQAQDLGGSWIVSSDLNFSACVTHLHLPGRSTYRLRPAWHRESIRHRGAGSGIAKAACSPG